MFCPRAFSRPAVRPGTRSLAAASLLILPLTLALPLALGCGGGSSSSGGGTAPTQTYAASVSPASLSFAATYTGATMTQPITLANTGTGALGITGIAFSGTNASSFTQTNTCGSTLAAGASCTVNVTFAPTVAGTLTGTLTISDNATAGAQSVALSGTAATASALVITPTALQFGTVAQKVTSAAQTVTITNSSNSAAAIGTISITGTNAASFAQTSNCASMLAANTSCTVSITFTPTATGAASAALSLSALLAPSTQLSGTGGSSVIALSPSTLSFAGGPVGRTTAAQTVTLTNSGNATLDISSITLSGTNAVNFTETTTCGTTVAAGASCTLAVTYDPAGSVAETGSLVVASDATSGQGTVALNGAAGTFSSSCVQPGLTPVQRATQTASYAGPSIGGRVLAGTQPIIGASVQLYAAGTTGNGSAPTALGAPALTAGDGSFTLPAVTCAYNLTTLYVVARGGQPGLTGAANPASVMALVLGACNGVKAGSGYVVNELSTVAAAYAFAPFFASGGAIGGSATNFAGLNLAANTAANLVNASTGTAPGAAFPSTATAPVARLNSLANALNACVTSATNCSGLFTAAYGTRSLPAAPPTNTLDAMVQIAQQPSLAVAGRFSATQLSTAYTPALTAAPADWTAYIVVGGGGLHGPSGLSVDSAGRIWVASYFDSATAFLNTGAPVFPNGLTGNLHESYGLAINQADHVLIPDEQTAYAVNSALGAVTQLDSAGNQTVLSAGGLNFPVAVAVDAGDVSWVVDYGNSHVTLLNDAGTPLSGTAGYTTGLFSFPVAVATDANCYGLIGNQSSDQVTRVSGDGTSFVNYVTGEGPSGLAVDAGNNVWVANYYGNTVGLIAASGPVMSGTGFAGGGLNHPQGIAVDGSGNVWVANYRAAGITELTGATSTTPGTPLTGSAGLASDAPLVEGFALAIDSTGSVWVSSFGNNTVLEYIGVAAPVRTPFIGAPQQP